MRLALTTAVLAACAVPASAFAQHSLYVELELGPDAPPRTFCLLGFGDSAFVDDIGAGPLPERWLNPPREGDHCSIDEGAAVAAAEALGEEHLESRQETLLRQSLRALADGLLSARVSCDLGGGACAPHVRVEARRRASARLLCVASPLPRSETRGVLFVRADVPQDPAAIAGFHTLGDGRQVRVDFDADDVDPRVEVYAEGGHFATSTEVVPIADRAHLRLRARCLDRELRLPFHRSNGAHRLSLITTEGGEISCVDRRPGPDGEGADRSGPRVEVSLPRREGVTHHLVRFAWEPGAESRAHPAEFDAHVALDDRTAPVRWGAHRFSFLWREACSFEYGAACPEVSLPRPGFACTATQYKTPNRRAPRTCLYTCEPEEEDTAASRMHLPLQISFTTYAEIELPSGEAPDEAREPEDTEEREEKREQRGSMVAQWQQTLRRANQLLRGESVGERHVLVDMSSTDHSEWWAGHPELIAVDVFTPDRRRHRFHPNATSRGMLTFRGETCGRGVEYQVVAHRLHRRGRGRIENGQLRLPSPADTILGSVFIGLRLGAGYTFIDDHTVPLPGRPAGLVSAVARVPAHSRLAFELEASYAFTDRPFVPARATLELPEDTRVAELAFENRFGASLQLMFTLLPFNDVGWMLEFGVTPLSLDVSYPFLLSDLVAAGEFQWAWTPELRIRLYFEPYLSLDLEGNYVFGESIRVHDLEPNGFDIVSRDVPHAQWRIGVFLAGWL